MVPSLFVMGTITIRAFENGVDHDDAADLDVVSDLLERPKATVWIDIDHREPGDLDHLAKELGLHHLAVEDALEERQRDKLIHYDHHLFLICHAVTLEDGSTELAQTEIDAFVGDRWMVTVHEDGGKVLDRVRRRLERDSERSGAGVGYLLYGLLDVVVDGYYEVLDQFEDYYDEAAERIFSDRPIDPSRQREWFEMRRALNRFDRIVTPLGDGLASLVARDLDMFAESAAPYIRDISAEVARAGTEVDALRELVGQITEVNMTLRDLRQNAVMKQVTSWAAIIAVPTLVSGYYGMNVPYPGSDQVSGVVTATAVSLGAAGFLYILFKRKGWI